MTESIPTFDNPDNSPLNIDERPTLLKVLCILSWIGAGFQIFVSTLYSLFINDTLKQKMFDILPSDEIVSMYKDIFILTQYSILI